MESFKTVCSLMNRFVKVCKLDLAFGLKVRNEEVSSPLEPVLAALREARAREMIRYQAKNRALIIVAPVPKSLIVWIPEPIDTKKVIEHGEESKSKN